MTDSDRSRFYGQLARILDSGIGPSQALSMLGDRGSGVAAGLSKELSLAQALGRSGGFSELEVWVIEAGEISGSLPTCCESLAEYFSRRHKTRQSVIAKLLYPAIVLHAVFLLPPLGLIPTGGLAAYLRSAVLPLVAIWSVVALTALSLDRVRSSPAAMMRWGRSLLRLPILGGILRDRSIALYAGGLALLLRAGLPMVESLDRAATMMPNRWLSMRAAALGREIQRGSGLAASMAPVFPATLVEMVRVGETTGCLDAQLEAASRFHDEEAQTALTRLVTVSSFLAFVLVAALVGGIVIKSWLAIAGLI